MSARPLRKIPLSRAARLAAAITPQIEVHHLYEIGQAAEFRLEAAVIKTGSAMDEEQCWTLLHARACRHQTRSVDIEIELHAVYADSHCHRLL